MRIDDLLVCDGCGAPAAYRDTLADESTCEACARTQGAERQGELRPAMDLLGFVAQRLRHGGFSDEQIHDALDLTLTEPHSTGDYPVAEQRSVPGRARTAEPWAQDFERLVVTS
jgi:hypothetical protein